MLFKAISLLVILLSGCFGQTNDFSIWSRSTAGETVVIPWYMNFGKQVVVDIRHNYDAKNTLGMCFGKKVGGEMFSVVPEACGYFGGVNGFGPELLVLGNKGRWNLFSQNQYVRGVRPADSFVYHWVDLLAQVNKNVYLGIDWQAFKLTNLPVATLDATAVDVGPSAKIVFGKTYVRIWPCWAVDLKDPVRRGNPTLFLGVGYVW